MRILAVADKTSDFLWGPGVHRGLEDIDLILSCGDLDQQYLEFLATFTQAPILYVHGNHDGYYDVTPPGGCECVDGRLVTVKGLRILGLGGSVFYNGESRHQYTQAEMRRRVWKLWWSIRKAGGFDILMTHAGAPGLGAGDDRAHAGFDIFLELIDKYRPAYFVHGHTHLTYNCRQKRLDRRGVTQVINAYERYVFDTDDWVAEEKALGGRDA